MLFAVYFLNRLINGGTFRCLVPVEASHPSHFVRLPSRNTKSLTPFGDAHTNVINCDNVVKSSVSHLLFASFPTAIIGFIISVIVSAANRVPSRWSAPHVLKEGLKAFSPFPADRNAARPIVLIFVVIGVVAPKFKLGPSLIFRRSCHTMGLFVGIAAKKFCGGSFGVAPTAFRTPTNEVGRRYDAKISTTAYALPHSVSSAWYIDALNSSKKTKLTTMKIKRCHSYSPYQLCKLEHSVGNGVNT